MREEIKCRLLKKIKDSILQFASSELKQTEADKPFALTLVSSDEGTYLIGALGIELNEEEFSNRLADISENYTLDEFIQISKWSSPEDFCWSGLENNAFDELNDYINECLANEEFSYFDNTINGLCVELLNDKDFCSKLAGLLRVDIPILYSTGFFDETTIKFLSESRQPFKATFESIVKTNDALIIREQKAKYGELLS